MMQSVDPQTQSASETPSLADVAKDTSQYVQAWSKLLASETRLAQASIGRLVLALLVAPALVLAICITFDALLVSLLQRWLHDWSSCMAIVLVLNLAGLFGLIYAMRRWWRNLSLPRSRSALSHLLERMA